MRPEDPHVDSDADPTALRKSSLSCAGFDKHDRSVALEAINRRRADEVVATLKNLMIKNLAIQCAPRMSNDK